MGVFYRTQDLTYTQKRDLLIAAKELCFTWWVDLLDCRVSLCRQTVQMDWEQALSKLTSDCHFTCIERAGCAGQPPYFEVAFSTMHGSAWYVWVCVEMSKAAKLISCLEPWNTVRRSCESS